MSTLWGWYGEAGILLAALSIPLILGHVPPNHWYGFRTSKTLSSAKLWRAANHYAGWCLLATGAATVAGA